MGKIQFKPSVKKETAFFNKTPKTALSRNYLQQ